MLLRLLLFAAITALFATAFAHADELPQPITPYVSDFANLIDPETEARLNNSLTKLRKDLDLEMAVVTIETRNSFGYYPSIEALALDMFNTWGIGNETRNDGVLILVARTDQEMRIELGQSYGPIYDDRMALVIEHHFIPYFKGAEYSSGIEAGTLETIKRLQPNYRVTAPESLSTPSFWESFRQTKLWRFLETKLALITMLAIFLFLYIDKRLKEALVGLKRCPNCNQRQMRRNRIVERHASQNRTGQEQIITDCSNCSYSAIEHRSIPSLRERSAYQSSSSSHFSGGRSSGGGASGGW